MFLKKQLFVSNFDLKVFYFVLPSLLGLAIVDTCLFSTVVGNTADIFRRGPFHNLIKLIAFRLHILAYYPMIRFDQHLPNINNTGKYLLANPNLKSCPVPSRYWIVWGSNNIFLIHLPLGRPKIASSAPRSHKEDNEIGWGGEDDISWGPGAVCEGRGDLHTRADAAGLVAHRGQQAEDATGKTDE